MLGIKVSDTRGNEADSKDEATVHTNGNKQVESVYYMRDYTVYVKTFEGENFRGSSTICIM